MPVVDARPFAHGISSRVSGTPFRRQQTSHANGPFPLEGYGDTFLSASPSCLMSPHAIYGGLAACRPMISRFVGKAMLSSPCHYAIDMMISTGGHKMAAAAGKRASAFIANYAIGATHTNKYRISRSPAHKPFSPLFSSAYRRLKTPPPPPPRQYHFFRKIDAQRETVIIEHGLDTPPDTLMMPDARHSHADSHSRLAASAFAAWRRPQGRHIRTACHQKRAALAPCSTGRADRAITTRCRLATPHSRSKAAAADIDDT